MTSETVVGRASAACVVVLAMLLSGCAAAGSEAGFGLPTLDGDEASAAFSSAAVAPRPLSGSLTVESNGCFTWSSHDDADGAWIVWPDGARQDGAVVVLVGGDRLGDGDELEATGQAVALADLPGGAVVDSYFGSFGGFCGADDRGVLVLTDASPQ